MSIPNYQLYRKPFKEQLTPFLNIVTLQDFAQEAGTDHHLHRHPSLFQLTYVTAGSGTHFINQTSASMEPGNFYLLRPGVAHACKTNGLRGYILHFCSALATGGTSLAFRHNYYVIPCPDADRQLVTGLCDRLQREPADQLSRPLLNILLSLLLNYRHVQTGAVVSSPSHHLVRGFVRLATVYYAINRNIGWYATQLHCSSNHLSSCVRAQLGQSPGRYLADRVLEDACQRLRLESTSVSEIARDLGFRNVDYFWRFFRRHVGQTPLAFRNSQKSPPKVQNDLP